MFEKLGCNDNPVFDFNLSSVGSDNDHRGNIDKATEGNRISPHAVVNVVLPGIHAKPVSVFLLQMVHRIIYAWFSW